MTAEKHCIMRGAILGMSVAGVALALGGAASAHAQEISSVFTKFDADKTCKHTPGHDVEDYGSWRCPGYAGLIVYLTAGDQRMQVSFGASAKKAANELAAEQTFPGFNSVYSGTVEWRIEKLPNGKTRPFATILRWNLITEEDIARGDNKATGRTLVVTRLNPGGVCHVGYVDARQPGANEAARKLADEKARTFRCGEDKAE
jgi:hypothetical protein